MPKLISLIGQPFGMLKVVSKGKLGAGRKWYWFCECECGNTKEISGCHLKSGDVRSCGCASNEFRSVSHTRHGHRKSRSRGPWPTAEYSAWIGLIDRCCNPRNESYKNYGGRGIRVCERWKNSFEAFLEDMGLKPSPEHSIDRHPNNDGNYEPGNTRWATYTQQARNRRGNRLVSFRGETKSVAEWAEIVGISYPALVSRLTRYSWTIERAMTQPMKKDRRSKHQLSA